MIAIVSSSHFPDDERIYYKQICSLLDIGKKIVYFTKSIINKNLSKEGLNHINYSEKLSINDFVDRVSREIFNRKTINQVQIHEAELLPLLKILKQKSQKTYTLYDVHEDMESMYRTFSNRNFIVRELGIMRRNFNEEKNLKFVDQIILANEPIRKSKYSKFKINRVVVENFVEIEFLKLNIVFDKTPDIIYHGHLGPERGIEDLVMAINNVLKKYVKVKLTLLGTFRTQGFQKKIHKLIKDLSLDDHIKILNQVPHRDVWKILRKASIGVIPFRKNPLTNNCTPTKLFEMMASSHQIVSTNLPPVRFFVKDSIHWAESDNPDSLGEAIIASIESLNDSSKIEKNIDLIKNKYNWGKIKSKYTSLFK
ncbi:MAG: glycosyltransferase [Candidatus Neomarinimicrobiota bacterium]